MSAGDFAFVLKIKYISPHLAEVFNKKKKKITEQTEHNL